ncbi:type IV toxin-antitoxin system AbiEi family antitoxin domain-containing protein [Intrasporangium flavum]|uniref:type IV toxin-antitoxin system AbiEi family antitoxin domain-containing protein n=1 Tax=Intrasporangium flavum TaxID=1428657 RepID=UPI00096D08C2|nr:type IV toxin-antitoxin system AbiEi family antitoxin domain-containing protein [Intrasporangium flavum]
MDSRLQALAGEQHGVFSAAEAARRGVGPTGLRAAVRAGEVIRVRRGAFVARAPWTDADRDERYRLAAMAVARTRPGEALSHHAALALYGLPLWRYDADRIDLSGSVRQAVRREGVTLHPPTVGSTCELLGLPAVPVATAVVRAALTMGHECAVVAGDAAWHRGLVDLPELLDAVAKVSPHEGRRRALAAVLRMDGKAESVGESRTRMILQDLGLSFESQVVIADAEGFAARVDFVVEGVVLEFDGRVKYQRARDDLDGAPADPGQVVWLEKRREDRVRRLGHPFERVIWSELDRPGLIGARIRDARPGRRSA